MHRLRSFLGRRLNNSSYMRLISRRKNSTIRLAKSLVFGNNIRCMVMTEALLLRKIPHGEADYILSLFTRDLGKVSGLAKNAKKSMKRFGGRLEPFVHTRVRLKDRTGGLKFIEDAETVRVFHTLMEDIELFTWGSYLLEYTDIVLPRETPNGELFDLLIRTLGELDSKKCVLPLVLGFQLDALSLSGYEPNLKSCVDCNKAIAGESFFSVKRGGAVCGDCSTVKQNSLISREFLEDRDSMDIYPGKVLKYIKLFTKFTEYHTEKELKSAKLIEELTI